MHDRVVDDWRQDRYHVFTAVTRNKKPQESDPFECFQVSR